MPPTDDSYPSLFWITIPPILVLAAYWTRKWYLARRLRLYGIGKGAPGFQTNVRRLRVTPEIAERLRRGENVSPEEIAAAAARMERDGGNQPEQISGLPRAPIVERDDTKKGEIEMGTKSSSNEWIPETHTASKKRAKGKKK